MLGRTASAAPYRRSLAPPPAVARSRRLYRRSPALSRTEGRQRRPLPVLATAASFRCLAAPPLPMLARATPCRWSPAMGLAESRPVAPVGGRPHRPCWRSPAPSLLGARPRRPLPELARAGLWPSSPVTGGECDEWGIFFSLFICFYYVGNREGPLRRRKIKLEGLFTK
jgi:hypothetical protein